MKTLKHLGLLITLVFTVISCQKPTTKQTIQQQIQHKWSINSVSFKSASTCNDTTLYYPANYKFWEFTTNSWILQASPNAADTNIYKIIYPSDSTISININGQYWSLDSGVFTVESVTANTLVIVAMEKSNTCYPNGGYSMKINYKLSR
jgi:hypothetical protein